MPVGIQAFQTICVIVVACIGIQIRSNDDEIFATSLSGANKEY
jgi:hypothetical protein